MKLSRALRERLCQVKIVALDFDGILTNGYVYTDESGKETVRCSRKDSLGIELLQKNNIFVGVISKEANSVVLKRCEKMKVLCYHNVKTGGVKAILLENLAKERKIPMPEVLYMGDDINDLQALRIAGVAVTVADAHPFVKEICDIVTSAKGGCHAVRELAEMIAQAKKLSLVV